MYALFPCEEARSFRYACDPVRGRDDPLTSSLTEKVPKLLGARLATRNGSIIIVKRDSRQADAVLGPN